MVAIGSSLIVVSFIRWRLELYTDESPGLKVDPVVVLVLSLGFIFSVVAMHGKSLFDILGGFFFVSLVANHYCYCSHCQDQQEMGGLNLSTISLFFFFFRALFKMVGMWMDWEGGGRVFTCVHQAARHIIKAKKQKKIIWVRACELRTLELGCRLW